LTPDEFIQAGDFLISKCPTWKWCSSEEKYYDKRLPKDKQYLKTNVPSYKRCSEYLKNNATTEKVVEGDWVDADLENKPKDTKKPTAIDLDAGEEKKKEIIVASKKDDDDDDDFVIEGDDNNDDDKKNDDFEIVEEEKKNEPQVDVVKTRKYDVTVTYDFYYRVPRMWLMGYNEKGLPLTDEEMKEDVMPEYRNKTCTIEPQTCTGLRNISVHPCRHSLLLKKMIQDFQNSGKKLEVHMSILLFLKFLQSVVPTVQYDYTMDISF
jgi:ubiquitin-like-conjugating enzyme ATG3